MYIVFYGTVFLLCCAVFWCDLLYFGVLYVMLWHCVVLCCIIQRILHYHSPLVILVSLAVRTAPSGGQRGRVRVQIKVITGPFGQQVADLSVDTDVIVTSPGQLVDNPCGKVL